MQRRDFIKRLAAISLTAEGMFGQSPTKSIAPTLPEPWMRGLWEAKPLAMTPENPDVIAKTEANFFSRRQMRSLRRLCRVLLPAYQGYPGAIEAATPEFLDFLLGISPVGQQEMYCSGLDWLDSEAQQRFARRFSLLQDSQVDTILRPWLQAWIDYHPPAEPHARFINIARHDIWIATTSSEIWSEAESAKNSRIAGRGLYFYPIDPDLDGRQSMDAHKTKSHTQHRDNSRAR